MLIPSSSRTTPRHDAEMIKHRFLLSPHTPPTLDARKQERRSDKQLHLVGVQQPTQTQSALSLSRPLSLVITTGSVVRSLSGSESDHPRRPVGPGRISPSREHASTEFTGRTPHSARVSRATIQVPDQRPTRGFPP